MNHPVVFVYNFIPCRQRSAVAIALFLRRAGACADNSPRSKRERFSRRGKTVYGLVQDEFPYWTQEAAIYRPISETLQDATALGPTEKKRKGDPEQDRSGVEKQAKEDQEDGDTERKQLNVT